VVKNANIYHITGIGTYLIFVTNPTNIFV